MEDIERRLNEFLHGHPTFTVCMCVVCFVIGEWLARMTLSVAVRS
jgi:hypothetical protein